MDTFKYLNSRLGKTCEHIKRAYLSNRHICFIVCSEPEFMNELLRSESFFPNIVKTNEESIQLQTGNSQLLSNSEKWIKPHLLVYNINNTDNGIPSSELIQYVNKVTSLSNCNRRLSNKDERQIDLLKQSLILVRVDSKPKIPTYIEPYTETISVPYMDELEFKEFVSLYLAQTENVDTYVDERGYNLVAGDNYLTKLYHNMMGLNATQIKAVLRKNQILLGKIYYDEDDDRYRENLEVLLQNIKSEFEKLVNASRALSVEDRSDKKPAGLGNIINWISNIKEQVSSPENFRRYLLESPKGMIVAGVPGSGKSMMAKYIAHEMGLTLLRFDIGNVGGGLVGESEKNMDDALNLIDTLTPCVLWVDEIEKAISINDNSHETTMTTFGKFLTWIQERATCFIFATSNDISKMPSELFRSGRFDGKYFTFMPTAGECAEIFDSTIQHQVDKCHKDGGKKLFDTTEINGAYFRSLLNHFGVCLLGFPNTIDLECRSVNKRNKFFIGADIAQLIKVAKTLYLQKNIGEDENFVFKSKEFKECLITAISTIKTYGETDLGNIAKCYAQLAINNFSCASNSQILPFDGYDDFEYKICDNNRNVKLYDLDRFKKGYEIIHFNGLKDNYDRCLYIIIRNTINAMASNIIQNIRKI